MGPKAVLISIIFSTVSVETGLVVEVVEVVDVVVGWLSDASSFLQATNIIHTAIQKITICFISMNFNEDNKNKKRHSEIHHARVILITDLIATDYANSIIYIRVICGL
jgi:hypothetical protein